MNIYKKKIIGKMVEFVVKKYKSHKRISDSIYNKFYLNINK